jgi:uncharacterized Tic20 family protein
VTQPPPQYSYAPPPPMTPENQRLWATLIHVGGIFFGILPSLIGYLVTKDRGAFIKEHTRVALNFHITVLIAAFVCGILSIILIGIFLLFALEILVVIFSILAAITASEGNYYRFPISIEFVK